ncbi:MAG: carbon-nitrogen hydrolase family protein [Bryobacteraceae bacterium]
MRSILLVLAIALPTLAATFESDPAWRPWAARDEIAPRTWKDTHVFRTAGPSLAISGNSNQAAAGGWEHLTQPVQPGQWYRLRAFFKSQSVPDASLRILARLDWRRPGGKRTGQPDYGYRIQPAGDWSELTLEAPAPPEADSAAIQLYLQNAAQGVVWWDDLSFQPIPAPGPRKVTVAAINLRPQKTGSRQASVQQFFDLVQAKVQPSADVILLPEGISIVGTGKNYAEVAETIPGPTSEKLGELARTKSAWVVAGIYEREGPAIYNTAILIDRAGNVAGKYRKVYLPREEVEGGLTPGSDYPVFHTDFGKIGIMICWDLQYADPARQLARRGAELLLVPIWGGNETLGKARAIENRVFVASSGYDYPTYVMDPDGEILAIAPTTGSAALATIDLNRRYADPWLGDMRGRFFKELRDDIP